MNSLAGRVALVTGGGRDVGAGISLTLAEAGATVAVNYQSSKGEAEAVVGLLRAGEGRRSRIDVAAEKAACQRVLPEKVHSTHELQTTYLQIGSHIVVIEIL